MSDLHLDEQRVEAYKRFVDGFLGWPSSGWRARSVRQWRPDAPPLHDPRFDELMAALTPGQRAYLADLLQEEREDAVMSAVTYLDDWGEEIAVRFYDEAGERGDPISLPRAPFDGALHEDLMARRMGRPWGDEIDGWDRVCWRLGDLLLDPARARGLHAVGDHPLIVPGEVVWAQPYLVVAPRAPESGHPTSEPQAIIEVSAPSTEERVRNTLVGAYALLPTVREVLVFASERVHAERYARTGAGGWREPDAFADPAAAVPLATLGIDLALADVYATSGLLSA